MISYCICVYRPRLFYILIEDLIRKQTTPYEILVWNNSRAPEIEGYIGRMNYRGVPIKLVGTSAENIGMLGYKMLFRGAKYEMIVQVHDDVVCVSNKIAERAKAIFDSHPEVLQVVADVIQDGFTTGGRPGDDAYQSYDKTHSLFSGPIDGWFSIYSRSALKILLDAPYEPYFYLGSYVQMQLRSQKKEGLLCKAMKVFHVAGPAYAQLLETVESEVRKYTALGNKGAADLYSSMKMAPEQIAQMTAQYTSNIDLLESIS